MHAIQSYFQYRPGTLGRARVHGEARARPILQPDGPQRPCRGRLQDIERFASLTTARFSGLYGVWYPHGEDDATFVRALLNQCRATVLSMRAIRAVNPAAMLVQTDDLSKAYGTDEMAGLVEFSNQRRWLSWDLLCGMVGPEHALFGYLCQAGATPAELQWFVDNRCPPDVVGVNY